PPMNSNAYQVILNDQRRIRRHFENIVRSNLMSRLASGSSSRYPHHLTDLNTISTFTPTPPLSDNEEEFMQLTEPNQGNNNISTEHIQSSSNEALEPEVTSSNINTNINMNMNTNTSTTNIVDSNFSRSINIDSMVDEQQ